MKALVFGTTGQLGIELARRAPRGIAIIAFGREAADLTDPATCARLVSSTDADVVINAAAYTAVDAAETDRDTAQVVNAKAPGAMARAAAALGVPFLHVSTDYVFDGSGDRPWREDDPVAPLGAYGQTKLDGERAIADAGGPHVILRTSWVFSAHGKNFVKTMLRVGAERDALSVVGDQRGGPTAAADIADALWAIASAFEIYASLGLLYGGFPGSVDEFPWLEGRDQAHAPRYTLAAGAVYRSANGFFARLDATARDEFYFDVSHDQKSQSYALLHARAGWEGENWVVQLWARNLTDRHYAVRGFYFGNEPPDFPSTLYTRAGDPRHVGLTIERRFH